MVNEKQVVLESVMKLQNCRWPNWGTYYKMQYNQVLKNSHQDDFKGEKKTDLFGCHNGDQVLEWGCQSQIQVVFGTGDLIYHPYWFYHPWVLAL